MPEKKQSSKSEQQPIIRKSENSVGSNDNTNVAHMRPASNSPKPKDK